MRIAIVNLKGGTGKTTSCLSIAGYLAKSGSKVLVVDFDPQANATSGLGIDKKTLRHSMYDAVLDQCDGHKGVPITQVIALTRRAEAAGLAHVWFPDSHLNSGSEY